MKKNKQQAVMVCVTRQRSSTKLIQRGAEIAREHGLALVVIHVARPGEDILGLASEGEALTMLFEMARQAGGQMEMVRAESFIDALTEQAREKRARYILMGASRGGETTIEKSRAVLESNLPDVTLEVIET